METVVPVKQKNAFTVVRKCTGVLLQRGKKFYYGSMNGNLFYRLVESSRSC